MANVVAFDARPKELSDSEALDWLRSQPGGRATANHGVLAERWGWSRYRVARRLKMWQAAGLIIRYRKVLTVEAKDETPVASIAPPPAPAPVAPAEAAPAVPAEVAPIVPPAPASPVAAAPSHITAVIIGA